MGFKVKTTVLTEARKRYPNITEKDLVDMAQASAIITHPRGNKRFGTVVFYIEKHVVKRIQYLDGKMQRDTHYTCESCGGHGVIHIVDEDEDIRQIIPCRKC